MNWAHPCTPRYANRTNPNRSIRTQPPNPKFPSAPSPWTLFSLPFYDRTPGALPEITVTRCVCVRVWTHLYVGYTRGQHSTLRVLPPFSLVSGTPLVSVEDMRAIKVLMHRDMLYITRIYIRWACLSLLGVCSFLQ